MTTTMKEDMMHGSIFVLLKRFVESSYDYSTWIALVKTAGIERTSYQMQEMYPTKELYALIHAVSTLTDTPVYELMEQYGEFLVPDLLLIYSKHIDPSWRTYEMLQNTEASMHGAVKKEDNRASPPMLLVTKKGSKELIVDYYSTRRMAGVAVGIIKGIARYYQESDLVEVIRVTPADQERVQIRVSFLN